MTAQARGACVSALMLLVGPVLFLLAASCSYVTVVGAQASMGAFMLWLLAKPWLRRKPEAGPLASGYPPLPKPIPPPQPPPARPSWVPSDWTSKKGDADAKCSYCGRRGPLGQCEGCGAQNTVDAVVVTGRFEIGPPLEPGVILTVPFDLRRR